MKFIKKSISILCCICMLFSGISLVPDFSNRADAYNGAVTINDNTTGQQITISNILEVGAMETKAELTRRITTGQEIQVTAVG